MKKIATIIFLTLFILAQENIAFAYNYNYRRGETKTSIQAVNNNDSDDAFSNNYQNLSDEIKHPQLSKIEKLFNGNEFDVTKEPLLQVGYNIFNASSKSGTSTTGKFDNTYKLSIGEKINAYLYGDSVDVMAISGSNLLSSVVQTEVDSKGNIFISGIGVVPAENRTISEVESAMNSMARAKYRSLKIKLNVASGQDFSVFVYGQVNAPGKVLINNNSSILDALGAAGGVKKTGTLRKIIYTNGKTIKEVDLYKAIFAGTDENIILRPNDKIFVGGIGNVVGLKNGVSVPGIYELKDGESLQKLTTYAGGLLPGTQQGDVVLTSLNSTTLERTAKNVSWAEANQTKLKSGDTIEFKELYNVAENTVTLQGNVKHPATFAYKEGMRLSDILKSENELLEETFITQAVIRRVSGKDNTIETIPIFLKEFFAGLNDPLLQPRDVINIYKNTNTEFVDVFGCISMPKHLTYVEGMNLGDVLTDIQFLDSKIVEEKNEETLENKISEDLESIEKEDLESNEKDAALKTENKATLTASTSNSSEVISAENVAVEITGKDENTQVYYLYDIMINGNSYKNITLMPGDKIFFRPLRENERIKNVRVSGFVKHPGVFKFVEGKRLTDMIEMADGLTADADLRGIVYTRKNIQASQVSLAKKNNDRDIKLLEGRLASGIQQSESSIATKTSMIETLKQERENYATQYNGRIALSINSNNLDEIKDVDNIEVQDGDEIYIPRLSKHISVIGEVYNEQSFVYKKGKKVKYYIKEVGGYTPNASKFRIYKVSVNGKAEKVHGWTKVAQGDTIVIPRKIAGNEWLAPICDALKGIASALAAVFVITKI